MCDRVVIGILGKSKRTSNVTVGFHPNFSFALVASPKRTSYMTNMFDISKPTPIESTLNISISIFDSYNFRRSKIFRINPY